MKSVEKKIDEIIEHIINNCGGGYLILDDSNYAKYQILALMSDELKSVQNSDITKTAKSGVVGEWITLDERIKRLGGYDI